ncbi:MAG: hypothetical protein WC211_00845 [Dehalococcoidia bacterium]
MEDATKQLECYASFDPAIDRDAMGAAFDAHFGRFGAAEIARAGTRDPSLIKFHPGKRACKFVLRPLTLAERFDCDAVVSTEHRLARALGYALVRAELHAPMSATATILFARDTQPGFTLEMLTELMGLVGVETIYEIGAVAYTRSRLGPFDVPFAPLLLTSAQRQVTQLLHHADSLARQKSDTQTTKQESPSQSAANETSAPPGDATAPESDTAPPDPAPPPTS